MNFIFDPSLVLYLPLYKLDGASFMSRDKHGHLCTATGALWTPHGRSFDGSDDKIDCGNATSLRLTSSLTLMAWVYPTTDDANKDIISNVDYGAGTTHGYRLTFGGTGNIEIRVKGASDGYITDVAYTKDTWTHATIVYDAVTPTLYIYKNGVDAGGTVAGTVPGSLNSVATTVKVGAGLNGASALDYFMNGTIGEVMVYSRALTPLEIQHNYLATKWRYR